MIKRMCQEKVTKNRKTAWLLDIIICSAATDVNRDAWEDVPSQQGRIYRWGGAPGQ